MKRTVYRSLLILLSFTGALSAQSAAPAVLWQQPTAIPYLTPLTSAQLNAIAVGGAVVPVPLAQSFNVTGITSAGVAIPDGGFDHVGRTYPAELIGTSIIWRGITFNLGPADAPDAVMQATITLPQGDFGNLLVLGALVDGANPPTPTFTITYTDGTTTTANQSFSDWALPLNDPGETIAACYPYRYWVLGPIERDSVCVYGYAIALDPAKTVKSVQLPNTPYILLLAAALEPADLDGVITYTPAAGTVLPPGTSRLTATFANSSAGAIATVPITVEAPPAPIVPMLAWPQPQPIDWGTALSALQLDATAQAPFSPTPVPLNGYVRAKVIDEDSVPFGASGVDGNGNAYSATQLGPALAWLGASFPLGAPAVPDAATSATIPLPSGTFDTLYLLGTAGQHAEPAQPFIVHYADGTSDTTNLSLSAWTAPQHFPGETIVSATPYADTSTGGQISGAFNVYGYRIPLDPTKSVASVQLPPNTDVMILAAALGSPGSFPVSGESTYTPSSGTILPEGADKLSDVFTPTDPTFFAPATATNAIVVTQPQLLVQANNASRLYGTRNPAFNGTITGAVLGNTFTESFTTSATPLSTPGAYPIIPSAAGSQLAQYQVVTTDGTLTIAKAPVNASVQPSASPAAQGASVTLLASITSTTSGTPTGTVQFFANGAALGTASLVQGKASLTTSTLAPGAQDITLQYNGDANFLSSSASTPVRIQAYDFTFIAPSGTNLNGTWGTQSTLVLHLAPQGIVYESSIHFAVTGIDSGLSSAHFAPQIVGSAAGPTDVQFTVTLDNLAQSHQPSPSPTRYLPLAALCALPFFARLKHRLLLTLSIATALTGCGSGYRTAAIPLIVTATDGTHTHTLALTLEISGPK